MAKVSVIMPAYNSAHCIKRSVESIMNQTMKDLELIIINDASTDSTWSCIEELIAQYGDRVKGINLPKNLRQGGARNRGIDIATGKYISFVDSDDWIERDMIERYYEAMESDQADLAGSMAYMQCFPDGTRKMIADDFAVQQISAQAKMTAKEQKDNLFLYAGGIWMNMYRRQVIMEQNIRFPEGLSYEDNYFTLLYFCYVNKYTYVRGAYYNYFQSEGSTLHRKDDTQKHRIIIEKMLYDEIQKRGVYEQVRDGYELSCIQRWLINTVGIYFLYFQKDAIEDVREVYNTFVQYFPHFRRNKYYKINIGKIDRFKLSMLRVSPWLVYEMYRIRQLLAKR